MKDCVRSLKSQLPQDIKGPYRPNITQNTQVKATVPHRSVLFQLLDLRQFLAEILLAAPSLLTCFI